MMIIDMTAHLAPAFALLLVLAVVAAVGIIASGPRSFHHGPSVTAKTA